MLLAVGLAMDAFSAAVAASVVLKKLTGRHIFRFAFHFGLFQAGMPLLGWCAGRTVSEWVASWDHWLAFALLVFVGVRAILEGLKLEKTKTAQTRSDPTRGWSLVVLSVATSIDAFAVGLSVAWLDVDIWLPIVVIGLVTAGLTIIGMLIGQKMGSRSGRRASILGGIILLGIGMKILLDHLIGSVA
ncbi:MAG: manganese efflux pump MntP family protein [Pseudomonadota bacterium]